MGTIIGLNKVIIIYLIIYVYVHIAFFIIALLVQLYVRFGILLARGKHLHDLIISLRGGGGDVGLTRHVLLKCLYQVRKVSNHLSVC